MTTKSAIFGSSVLLLGVLLFSAEATPNPDQITMAKLVHLFPSEEQMNQCHIVFHNPSKFAVSDRYVFICDSGGQTIYYFDLDGNFIGQFGRPGQGPGEFTDPVFIIWYKSRVYVTDRGNTRIQVFSEDGIWKETWNPLRYILSPAVDSDTIMVESPEAKYLQDQSASLFTFFNLHGEVVRTIPGYLKKTYSDSRKLFEENYVTLRSAGGVFHSLQVYGDIYRVFGTEGNKIKEFKLERDPLKEERYRKLGYLYAYPTYDISDDKILAYRISKGSIEVDNFNMDGKYIQTYRCPMNPSLIYFANDMKIVRRSDKVYVYLLLIQPDSLVAVIELGSLGRLNSE
jgi:hypothetical protein